ncbi:MAG: helix-turn-helix domain-containing protein, partial [Bacteroidales bacterium]|nr:helix-turn-helix domain-containing protein [Bacteroidales bacterium]
MSAPVGSHFFRLTPDDIEDVRRMTLAGKTAGYIAEYIGCSVTTVHNYVRRLGIKPRVFRSNCYT